MFFLVLVLIVFSLLIVRCVYLQYFQHEHYNSLSIEQQLKWIPVESHRGIILDSMGRVLAAGSTSNTVFAEPRVIKDPKDIANKLAVILDIPAHKICERITESRNPGFVRLKRGVDYETAKEAQEIHYGIGVKSELKREYPTGRLVSNLLGFTGSDNRGLEGLELRYDGLLTGKSGKRTFLADAARRSILLKDNQLKAEHGKGLILTIDSAIQQFARSHLLERYEKYQAESAIAIVAEPDTGAILALVSLPDFDPENIQKFDSESFRNRAVTDVFEPGSIMKPIVAAIALDEGVVNKTEKIYCEEGSYRGSGFGSISEYRNHSYGNLTVKEILIHSSNIGMAKLGQRLGKNKLYRGLRLLGFGQRTGIEIYGEVSGLLRKPSEWTGYSVTRIPFGQEISVTALQVVQAYCILANGGYLVKPHLVKAVVDNKGELVRYNSPLPPVGFAVDSDVAEWIVGTAMADVVNEGTGRRAKLEKWQVFGKTGTANIAEKNKRGYSHKNYVASFIAGAPAEEPEIIVFVSIRKPDRSLGLGYTGGVVASPAAGEIIKDTLTYLENQGL